MREKSTEELITELETLRSKIAEVKGEREHVESLPPPVEAAITAKNKQIDSVLAELSDPECDVRRQDTALILIGIFGDQLKESFTKVMQRAWPRETCSDQQKVTHNHAIDRELLKLETVEEKTVCTLQAAGVSVTRRPDLDPRVFFEVTEDE